MPIYEFKCDDCSHKFEELVSLRGELPKCPSCKSTNTKKQLSVFAATSGSSSSSIGCPQPNCGSGFS